MVLEEEAIATRLGAPAPAAFADTAAEVERVREGNQESFARLWRRFLPGLQVLVAGRIRTRLGPDLRWRLEAEAEDLLQDVMLKAYSSLDSFECRGQGSFMAWLRRITENELKNRIAFWRADRRDPAREQAAAASAETLPTDPGPADPRPGPPTSVRADEQRRRVAAALAGLEDLHHDLLHLRFFAGADWQEIADLLGLASADAARMECTRKSLPALAAALAVLEEG